MVFVAGILAAIAIPKYIDVSARTKMSEVTTVLAAYETAQLSHLGETGTIGDCNAIPFGKDTYSKWFDYEERTPGTFSATAKQSIGTFPEGGTLITTVYETGGITHSVTGADASIVKKYLPDFMPENN